jgi:hypothetical protein
VHAGWRAPEQWAPRAVEQRTRPVGHYTVSKVFGEAVGHSYAAQVRETPSWPRSWAVFSLL